MAFIAVMAATEDGRVGKYQEFATQSEAQAHAAAFVGTYPDAFAAEMPEALWTHWLVDMGAGTVSIDAPRPTVSDIDAERDRRIAMGFTAITSEAQSVPCDTRHAVDFRNIQGLATAGMVRQGQGDTTPFTYRGSDNVDYTLTPTEMIEVGMQALAHVDAHYKASWAIKDADPIPIDFDDDSRWP